MHIDHLKKKNKHKPKRTLIEIFNPNKVHSEIITAIKSSATETLTRKPSSKVPYVSSMELEQKVGKDETLQSREKKERFWRELSLSA